MRPAVVLLTLLLAGPALGQARIAVLPLLGYGVPSDRVEAVEAALAPAVDAAAGRVLDKQQTRELLTLAESSLDCRRAAVSCLVDIGALMAVGQLVAGKVEAGGEGGLVLTLRVIDVIEGKEDRRFAGRIAPGEPLGASVRKMVFRLFHDSAAKLGGILVEVEEEGAEVLIDGEPVGTSPLADPVHGLAVGAHTVLARLEGFDPVERTVDVQPGALHQIQVRIKPPERDDEGIDRITVRRFGFGVIVGAGVVGALGLPFAVGGIAWALAEVVLGLGTLFGLVVQTGDCVDGECDVNNLAGVVDEYHRIQGRNWVAGGIGAAGAVISAFALGGLVAGLIMVGFSFGQDEDALPPSDPGQPGAGPDPQAEATSAGRGAGPVPKPAKGLAFSVAQAVQSALSPRP